MERILLNWEHACHPCHSWVAYVLDSHYRPQFQSLNSTRRRPGLLRPHQRHQRRSSDGGGRGGAHRLDARRSPGRRAQAAHPEARRRPAVPQGQGELGAGMSPSSLAPLTCLALQERALLALVTSLGCALEPTTSTGQMQGRAGWSSRTMMWMPAAMLNCQAASLSSCCSSHHVPRAGAVGRTTQRLRTHLRAGAGAQVSCSQNISTAQEGAFTAALAVA